MNDFFMARRKRRVRSGFLSSCSSLAISTLLYMFIPASAKGSTKISTPASFAAFSSCGRLLIHSIAESIRFVMSMADNAAGSAANVDLDPLRVEVVERPTDIRSRLFAAREPIQLQDNLVLRACRRGRDDDRQSDAEKRHQDGTKEAQVFARVGLHRLLLQL